MNGKNRTWIVVILIVITALSLLYFLPRGVEEEDFIEARFYDSEGKLITDTTELSVVEGVSGVDTIDLTINVRNTGDIALSCSVISVSPEAFDLALDQEEDVRALPANSKISWTTERIEVAQFESETESTTFSAEVGCSYNTGTEIIDLVPKTGSLTLTIRPEGVASFEVELIEGGIGSEFCGDGFCQENEDSVSCPQDCAAPALTIVFRTSDLSYVPGSAIAFTDSCGNELVAYGYETRDSSGGICEIHPNLGDAIMSSLPGTITTGENITLYWDTVDSHEVWVCEGSTAIRYDDRDADKTLVDTSPTLINELKEKPCP